MNVVDDEKYKSIANNIKEIKRYKMKEKERKQRDRERESETTNKQINK